MTDFKVTDVKFVSNNWDLIEIPREIEDLDKYLSHEEITPLTEENEKKYQPFVIDLVAMVDEKWQLTDLNKRLGDLRRKYKICPTKTHMIEVYRNLRMKNAIKANTFFERIIRKKFNRSTSGVVVVTVLLGPGKFSCPMDCDYCPNDPAIARSYLLDEPAVRRGFKNKWDAVSQFMDCARRLDKTGHVVTKVEIIIEGGTFGSYPHDYIEEYFRDLYYAANIFAGPSKDTPQDILDELAKFPKDQLRPRLSLKRELEINQTSVCAIIGITAETRPDWIDKKEILRFRELGITRVQLGIQHIDDDVLEGVNRKCPTYKTIKAMRLLKQNGYKVDAHFMPDLPGSSYDKDLTMFNYLLSDQNILIRPDQWKIYPTMVAKHTKILDWYNEGKYKPYGEINKGELVKKLMTHVCTIVSPEIRFNRVVRDIPKKYTDVGFDRVNLRQEVEDDLKGKGLISNDIRGREVKGRTFDLKTAQIWIDKYSDAGGIEYFISCENDTRQILYGFVRLRISKDNTDRYFKCLENAALIRELHVYGELVHQNDDNTGSQAQHLGIGTLLMNQAEQIALQYNFDKMAVISGVGVRGFYKKKGYQLEETYMVKNIKKENLPIVRHPMKIIYTNVARPMLDSPMEVSISMAKGHEYYRIIEKKVQIPKAPQKANTDYDWKTVIVIMIILFVFSQFIKSK